MSIVNAEGDPSLRFGMTRCFGVLGGKKWRFERLIDHLSGIFYRIATSFPSVTPQRPVILSPPAGGRRIPTSLLIF